MGNDVHLISIIGFKHNACDVITALPHDYSGGNWVRCRYCDKMVCLNETHIQIKYTLVHITKNV